MIASKCAWSILLPTIALVLTNRSTAIGASLSVDAPTIISTGLISATKRTPAALSGKLIAQAKDLGPPPSPDAIVTTPPPPPIAEFVPPPAPGYAWDPGRWSWNGSQYVWAPGRYIVQPTNGATFTPGYWQEYSGGWAWTEGRWSWATQSDGE
jgi:hypothetical protein